MVKEVKPTIHDMGAALLLFYFARRKNSIGRRVLTHCCGLEGLKSQLLVDQLIK
ncbi:hypothetical protein [Scopulibacillus darangshiensis]|uniref:hypothetical protein n=1 Tax=Scopulibacillus darangshiensis TaxID=442528 RepID=UPI0014053F28|nr:hypothetical protein [Scopulibacillus darangshiensis]